MPWLYYVCKEAKMTSPKDCLLHYPIPGEPIEGFPEIVRLSSPLHSFALELTTHLRPPSHQMITLSNYTGDAREYIKKLIDAMGGLSTPDMSRKNTHVVAAS